ncbi:MAG TPA: hypothetical protein VFZ60_10945 [Nitrososphaeraceae archaeon]
MENLKQESSNLVDEASKKVQEGASQLPEIIKQVVDKLIGKNMEVTYDFQNLEVDVPRVTGPDGKEIASAKWKLNGKFILSTQLLESSGSSDIERDKQHDSSRGNKYRQ